MTSLLGSPWPSFTEYIQLEYNWSIKFPPGWRPWRRLRHQALKAKTLQAGAWLAQMTSLLGGSLGAIYATNMGSLRPFGIEGWRVAFFSVAMVSIVIGVRLSSPPNSTPSPPSFPPVARAAGGGGSMR